MSSLALGIMSGTSGDGISMALARFKGHSYRLLNYETYGYPKSVRTRLTNPAALGAGDISTLNFLLGNLFADSAVKFLKASKVRATEVSVVGSHGQTVFHDPLGKPSSTLQIGESSAIAEKTGIPVVSNFRERDVAAGGEGAPLIPFFDQYFFGKGPLRTLVNIGGIANLTFVGQGAKVIAFDTGPGNCLIDWAAARAAGGKTSFDPGGRLAEQGTIRLDLVKEMASHPYFSRRPPKSTGREVFNPGFIPKRLLKGAPRDVLATLTYFTAFSIWDAHQRFLPASKIKEVIVSGGGALNHTLMGHLRSLFAPLPVRSIAELGIHPQAKEPMAFAFFAWRAIQGKENHLPEGTGAKGVRILGKITPGKH